MCHLRRAGCVCERYFCVNDKLCHVSHVKTYNSRVFAHTHNGRSERWPSALSSNAFCQQKVEMKNSSRQYVYPARSFLLLPSWESRNWIRSPTDSHSWLCFDPKRAKRLAVQKAESKASAEARSFVQSMTGRKKFHSEVIRTFNRIACNLITQGTCVTSKPCATQMLC